MIDLSYPQPPTSNPASDLPSDIPYDYTSTHPPLRLVSDEILEMVNPGARMVYVGKQVGLHTRSQDEIHTLLLAFAEAGATVIRLKVWVGVGKAEPFSNSRCGRG